LIPLNKHPNLYVKDSTGTLNFNVDGKFFEKEELMRLSKAEK